MPTLRVNGTKVGFAEAGEGDSTVVLLHSSASSSAQWRTLREQLSDDYRLLMPDLYGYGSSDDWSGDRPMRLTDEAAAIKALISQPGEPVHLVGHSYGGAVALRVALEQPALLQSLTLIEPVAFHLLRRAGDQLYREVCTIANSVRQSAARGDNRAGMAQFVDYWNGDGTWANLNEEKRMALAERTPKVALDFWSTTTEDTPLDVYRELDVPALILWGERTPAPARRIGELLTQALPSARHETIPGAGHMSPLTHARIVNDAIAEHLVRSEFFNTLHADRALDRLSVPAMSA
ncbi:MAG: alpha/beta fold hydrolase [Acidiferrobacterales bacterium]